MIGACPSLKPVDLVTPENFDRDRIETHMFFFVYY